jgi:cytochrome P450
LKVGARGINTVEPRNIEAILSRKFDGEPHLSQTTWKSIADSKQDFDLGLRPVHFAPLMGSGIFTQDGTAWKHSRDLLRPQFASNRYQNFAEVKKCVEDLLGQIPANGVIDLQPLFFRLTFDTTTFLLFGETTSSLQSTVVAGHESEFAKAFNLGQDYLSHRGRLGAFYWLMNTPGFRKACKTTHAFVDAAVQQALDTGASTNEGNGRYVFIDALVQQTRDKKMLRDQCLNVLLAGRDTTACCLSWTMYVARPNTIWDEYMLIEFLRRLLVRHPRVLSKLRDEVEQIVGLGHDAPKPSRDDIKNLTYLKLIIKEVLRLYPSVPVNSRAAIRTTTIPSGGGPGGHSPILVRKGEAVGYCVYAMHRRKDIYGDDALDFRPERWERDLLKDVGYGYLPFNGGPRTCLGQDSAMLEASYTVARILQCFPLIKLPADESNIEVGMEKQTLTLVVAPAEGCRLQFVSRDAA